MAEQQSSSLVIAPARGVAQGFAAAAKNLMFASGWFGLEEFHGRVGNDPNGGFTAVAYSPGLIRTAHLGTFWALGADREPMLRRLQVIVVTLDRFLLSGWHLQIRTTNHHETPLAWLGNQQSKIVRTTTDGVILMPQGFSPVPFAEDVRAAQPPLDLIPRKMRSKAKYTDERYRLRHADSQRRAEEWAAALRRIPSRPSLLRST